MEIRISLEELFKSILLRLKFPILVIEHPNGAASMDDQNLSNYTTNYFSVIFVKARLVLAPAGNLDLFVKLKFTQNLLMIFLLIFSWL
jgi:hypothetical protein